jgi:hypothetical protein
MKAMTQQGHSTEVIRCDGIFATHCTAMSGVNVGFESSELQKWTVCRTCRKRSQILDNGFEFGSFNFENQMDPNDLEIAKQITSNCDVYNWSDFMFRGFPVGAIAAYEILLNHKIDSRALPNSVWNEYRSSLTNTVLVVIVAERILRQTRPDRVVVYNSLYALNNAYVHVARSLGIPTFTLQGGPHISQKLNTLTCYSDPSEIFSAAHAPEVSEWLACPIDTTSLSIVSQHLRHLLLGESAFAYSSAPDPLSQSSMLKNLNISTDQPVFTALLSSEDEFFAASIANVIPIQNDFTRVFESQTEWIKWLISFASKYPEIQVVFRVHPRMFPNKREGKIAPYVKELMDIFSETPANVHINWPTDNVSLYDLMQYTDVVLNYRSSAGVEMMSYGLPVVLPGNYHVFSSPPGLCLTATDKQNYEDLIFQALDEGWSLENVRKTFRWLGFLLCSTVVEVHQKSPSRIARHRPKTSEKALKAWRFLAFAYLQSGFLMSERNQMREATHEMKNLDNLVKAILENRRGIYLLNRRSEFDKSSIDEETYGIQKDLDQRMSLLRNKNEISSPLHTKHAKFKSRNEV